MLSLLLIDQCLLMPRRLKIHWAENRPFPLLLLMTNRLWLALIFRDWLHSWRRIHLWVLIHMLYAPLWIFYCMLHLEPAIRRLLWLELINIGSHMYHSMLPNLPLSHMINRQRSHRGLQHRMPRDTSPILVSGLMSRDGFFDAVSHMRFNWSRNIRISPWLQLFLMPNILRNELDLVFEFGFLIDDWSFTLALLSTDERIFVNWWAELVALDFRGFNSWKFGFCSSVYLVFWLKPNLRRRIFRDIFLAEVSGRKQSYPRKWSLIKIDISQLLLQRQLRLCFKLRNSLSRNR